MSKAFFNSIPVIASIFFVILSFFLCIYTPLNIFRTTTQRPSHFSNIFSIYNFYFRYVLVVTLFDMNGPSRLSYIFFGVFNVITCIIGSDRSNRMAATTIVYFSFQTLASILYGFFCCRSTRFPCCQQILGPNMP